MPEIAALSRDDLGHLNYLHRALTAPANNWDSFYRPQSENMNFALRFQLGFAAYAVAALGLRTPAYRAPYAAALGATVSRMLDVRAWGYWRVQAAQENAAAQGHVALMLSPHRRAATMTLPPPGDPIVQDNVQYSGHLGTMIGLYERASGDHRYDNEFVLSDPESGVSFTYTHTAVASRIHEQMRDNYFHGVACEPSCAYVPCNNHAMSSNTMHDATHGTDFAAANKDWIGWVRKKMVLKGATMRGLFGACFLRDVGVGAPVAFQFTDSWGLSFLQPFDRKLAQKLYRVFRKRISREGGEYYVGSASICEKMEISDVQLNTAFGQIAARGLGDEEMAAALASYADNHFAPRWDGTARYYSGAPRTLHTTALLALGAIADNETMHKLFHAPATLNQRLPELTSITTPDGVQAAHIGVAAAEYKPDERKLDIRLLNLGETTANDRVVLRCGGIGGVEGVTVDGAPSSDWSYSTGDARLELTVPARDQHIELFIH